MMPNNDHQYQWKRRGREWAASFVGIAVMLAVVATAAGFGIRWHGGGGRLARFMKLNAVGKVEDTSSGRRYYVNQTLVSDAEQKGAVCLDGSPPAYHFRKGYGSGADSWVIFLEGGGWCTSLGWCYTRGYDGYWGSSKRMEHEVYFEGILSDEESHNPEFYNWNQVFIRYCDGASFMGDTETQLLQDKPVFFRGHRIWYAVMDELLNKGLSNATQALLTGCSAGGLATFFHCDDFRALLPASTIVKCMADAGFFIDGEDIKGRKLMRKMFNETFELQDIKKHLNKDCLAENPVSDCYFPAKQLQYMKTPFFVLNSPYDWWQVFNTYLPDVDATWRLCKNDINKCNSEQLKTMNGLYEQILSNLADYRQKGGNMYIDSCYQHCQSLSNWTWHTNISTRLNNKSIAESVGDWFFGRATVQAIDIPYPGNPSCVDDALAF